MDELRAFTELYTLSDNTIFFEDIQNSLNSSEDKKEVIENFEKVIQERKKALENLKTNVEKASKIMNHTLNDTLLSQINKCLSSLDSVLSDIKNLSLETKDASIMDDLQEHINNVTADTTTLDDSLEKSKEQYLEAIYFAVKTGGLTIDDIESIKDNSNLSNKDKDEIEEVIDRLKQEKEMEATEVGAKTGTEQDSIKETKGFESLENEALASQLPSIANELLQNYSKEELVQLFIQFLTQMQAQQGLQPRKQEQTALATTEQKVVKQEPEVVKETLKQRIDKIVYVPGMNYSHEVSKVRAQFEIEKLEEQIKLLKGKGKLKLTETARLQALVAQVESLNEFIYNVDLVDLKGKESKREEKLEDVDTKRTDIQKKRDAVHNLKEQQESKLFKMVSARKEQKLNDKISKLRTKQSLIQTKQQTSTLLKFDKENKKLARKAKISGIKNTVVQTTNDKITELKQFRDNVLKEAQALTHDIKRFVRKTGVIERLKAKQGSIIAEPRIINGDNFIIIDADAQELEQETSLARVA